MLSWISPHSGAFSCHHTLSLDSLTKTSSLCYLLYIHQPDKLWGIIHASATAAQLLEVQTASAKYWCFLSHDCWCRKGSAWMRCSFHYYHVQLILIEFLAAGGFISLSYISFLSLLCFNQFLIGIVQRSCAPEQDPRYQWHYPLHAAPYMLRREPPFRWALAVG